MSPSLSVRHPPCVGLHHCLSVYVRSVWLSFDTRFDTRFECCPVSSAESLCMSVSLVVILVFFVWCLLPCLSGGVGFCGSRCLVCVCVSFSVFFVPSVLTDSGSGCGHCEHFRFWSRAFSAHPAGLRSTHCVFLRSLLVGVSFRSCWHRFPSIRSFCVGSYSTHCVFLRSLLVGFSFRLCWHWSLRDTCIRSLFAGSFFVVRLAVHLAPHFWKHAPFLHSRTHFVVDSIPCSLAVRHCIAFIDIFQPSSPFLGHSHT